jgi:hypothetical protein
VNSNKFDLFIVTVFAATAATPALALFQEGPEPNIMALFGIGAVSAILAARYFGKK